MPLSAVSFFASSLFFAAAICHAGMAARPADPRQDCTGLGSAAGVGEAVPLAAPVLAPPGMADEAAGGVLVGCSVDAGCVVAVAAGVLVPFADEP